MLKLKIVELKDLQALHNDDFDLLLLLIVALPRSRMGENAEDLASNQKSSRNVTIEISNITNTYCLADPKYDQYQTAK